MAKTNGQTPPVGSGSSNPYNGWRIDSVTKRWKLGDYDSGVVAEGKDGETPTLGENGNWFIGQYDTGKSWRGESGPSGARGSQWFFVQSNTTTPPSDEVGTAKVADVIMNTSVNPINISNTAPVAKGEFVEVVSISPFTVTPVKGKIEGPAGDKGDSGENGTPGSRIEERYAVNGSMTVPPAINQTQREPAGWSTTPPADLPVGQYLWVTKGTISYTNALIGVWITPQRLTGGQGKNGSAPVVRGDWSSTEQYSGTELLIELVKYEGYGYLTRSDAGDIPVGTLPTNTAYWNGPIENVDALIVSILIAYQAYIQNLRVGSLSTAVSGQRMDILEGNNSLRFFNGTDAFQKVEVGIFSVESVNGLGEPITIEVSGMASRNSNTLNYNFVISDKGAIINEGQMYYGFKTISSGTPVNRLYIYAKLVVKGNFAADSIFSDNYQAWDNIAKEMKSGYTGTINGAKFVNGICVGPA